MKFYSEYDKNGALYVDCTECTKQKYCSAGAKVKKPNRNGCFLGKVNAAIAEKLKREGEK